MQARCTVPPMVLPMAMLIVIASSSQQAAAPSTAPAANIARHPGDVHVMSEGAARVAALAVGSRLSF